MQELTHPSVYKVSGLKGVQSFLTEISEETTLEQIIKSCPLLQFACQGNNYFIIIARKPINYSRDKSTKLKDLENNTYLRQNRNGSINIISILKQCLGGDGQCNSFGGIIHDFNSFKTNNEKEFSKQAPDWRIIYQGANFQGTCNNNKCDAVSKKVWTKWGYETWDIGKVICKSMCPICGKKLSEIKNIGVYKGRLKINGQIRGKDEQTQKQFIHSSDTGFLTFSSNSGGDQSVQWQFLQITVKEL